MLINKRPFNVVDTDEFKEMMVAANARYTPPTRKKIRRVVTEMYRATDMAVKQVMKANWKFCPSYTCDLWTAAEGS